MTEKELNKLMKNICDINTMAFPWVEVLLWIGIVVIVAALFSL